MAPNQIITFTSDFGDADGYVGIVKGAILSVNPNAKIVDICHDVKPFNISSAAWIIYNSFNYFPSGTIHIVVVDPGVGSEQRRVLLQQGEDSFVGPDNGIFSLIVEDPLGKRGQHDRIEVYDLLAGPSAKSELLSSTFHARDLFGPVAGRLSLGHAPAQLGQKIPVDSLEKLNDSESDKSDGHTGGRVLHIDRFGNLITNLPSRRLSPDSTFTVNERKIGPIAKTYRAVDKGQLIAIEGSHGFLEIAVCEGRADEVLQAQIGTRVFTESEKR